MGCINTKAAQNVVMRTETDGETNAVATGKSTSVPAVNPNSFEEQYALGKVIGSGTFSVVRTAVHKPTTQRYAIKCIKRDGLVAEDIEALTTEVAILKQMNHPNIMILHDFFVEDTFYYLVTEFMEGGELFDRIVEKSYYNEREARDLVKLLLEAIKYCHDANIVHRDLKPENLLLTSKDDDASIKLADFGFAKRVELNSEGLVTACGTPGYVAPEILEGKSYGKTVDIWSIGVITYILLCGYPPFHDDNHNALFKKIKSGKFEFDAPYWDHVSDDAKDLISEMLVVNPEKRATVDQLLAHRWVTGTDVATVQLTSALEELRRFNARRKFKAAVSTVSATVGLSKKYSKSYSQPQSFPDESVADGIEDVSSEVSPDSVDRDDEGKTASK
uniref:Protein kinase domain-containing protein n=1 Tax=Peronospora matthiolae TaxID=2874970 RepID=A0AAV1U1P8_9STRA